MAVINSDALKVVAQLNKKYGANTVVAANNVVATQRVTTGSLTLDVVLGGGWPMNRWVELVGEASHGKTAIALRTIAANQKVNPDFTAVWIAAEDFDSKYAELCGVITERVILVETNSMENAYEAVIKLWKAKLWIWSLLILFLPWFLEQRMRKKWMNSPLDEEPSSPTSSFEK